MATPCGAPACLSNGPEPLRGYADELEDIPRGRAAKRKTISDAVSLLDRKALDDQSLNPPDIELMFLNPAAAASGRQAASARPRRTG